MTTPQIRAAIQASPDVAQILVEHYGRSEQAVWYRRERVNFDDLSRTPHRLHMRFSPVGQAVDVTLRTTVLLPLDDLVAVLREFFNTHVQRTGLARRLRHNGVGNLR